MCRSAAAFAAEGDYVVCLEPVDEAAVFVAAGEACDEGVFVEVCGDVGEFVPAGPDVVARQEEVVGEGSGFHAVEDFFVVEADVVEADVLRLWHEAAAVFFVEGVAVEVVVDGIVVDHLGYGEVVEEAGGFDAAEVFGEALHDEGFADAEAALEHDVFVEFVVSVGEDVFGFGAVVEVEEEEADDLAVVVVDDEGAALWSDDDVVCDVEEEVGVQQVDVGVGEVGEGADGFAAVVFGAADDGGDMCGGGVDVVVGAGAGGVEEGLVPGEVAGWFDAVFGECSGEAVGVLCCGHCEYGLGVEAAEAAFEGVVGRGLCGGLGGGVAVFFVCEPFHKQPLGAIDLPSAQFHVFAEFFEISADLVGGREVEFHRHLLEPYLVAFEGVNFLPQGRGLCCCNRACARNIIICSSRNRFIYFFIIIIIYITISIIIIIIIIIII